MITNMHINIQARLSLDYIMDHTHLLHTIAVLRILGHSVEPSRCIGLLRLHGLAWMDGLGVPRTQPALRSCALIRTQLW